MSVGDRSGGVPSPVVTLSLLGEYQNVWGQATMATPIRAGFTGSMTKNGGGLPLPEQIRTPHILMLPR